MIPENIDRRQLELFGLQQSVTEVRYHPVDLEKLSTLFEDGDHQRAFQVIADTLKEFERRIAELEAKQ